MKKMLMGVVAVGCLALAGCSDDNFGSSTDGTGRILASVDLNTDVVGSKSQKAASRADGVVSVSDLSLRLFSASGYQKVWDSADDFPVNAEYPVGDYTLEAWYGDSNNEGFDMPYYYGSQQLKVLENKTTPVSLTASLANSMVSVRYTDAVLQYFTSCQASVVSASGNTLSVASSETRPLYITPGNTQINVAVVKQNGVGATLNPLSFTAEARHHYTVTFDVNGGNVGVAELVVTFSSELVDEDVVIDLSDEILNLPAPTAKTQGFESSATVNCIGGTVPDRQLRMVFSAPAEMKTVVLQTTSTCLLKKGWPAEVDFATASASTLATLRSLGLQMYGVEGTMSKMAVLDFTEVARYIDVDDAGDNSSTFVAVAKDRATKASEPVSLTISVEPIEMEIQELYAPYDGDTEMSFLFSYNGADVAKEVSFERRNELGRWVETPIVSVEEQSSRAATKYLVKVTIPASGALEFRAVLKSNSQQATATLTVDRAEPQYNLTAQANDVFATSATLSFVNVDGSDAAANASNALYYISESGSPYSQVSAAVSGTSVKLTSLKPATSYTVRAAVDGKYSTLATFTTEAATQLPNSGMEDWFISDSGSNWDLYYPGTSVNASVWGTSNAMTTEQGADLSYCRISGTLSDNNGRTGKCAYLRSIGWGSGNTAAGNLSTRVMKYGDAGLLHLGSTRSARPSGYSDVAGPLTTDDLDCGLAFASRPSGLTFWYKYTPKNSADRGYAEVAVYDASGNTLASATLNLDTAGSFTQATLPLSYAAGAAKAAKVYVKFLSSNSRDYLTKDTKNFTSPSFGNLSDGKYLGSQLWIDDIELTY